MERVERKNASSVFLAYTLFFPFGGIFFLSFLLTQRFKRWGNYSADLILSLNRGSKKQTKDQNVSWLCQPFVYDLIGSLRKKQSLISIKKV